MGTRPYDRKDLYGRLLKTGRSIEDTATTIASTVVAASTASSLTEIAALMVRQARVMEKLVVELRLMNKHLSEISRSEFEPRDLRGTRGDMV